MITKIEENQTDIDNSIAYVSAEYEEVCCHRVTRDLDMLISVGEHASLSLIIDGAILNINLRDDRNVSKNLCFYDLLNMNQGKPCK